MDFVGEIVGHYRVLEKVGGGGMGVIYKAEDTKLNRLVALKFLPDRLSGDSLALQRFSREAHAASALNHPNICTIYEIGEDEGRPFIVMELMEGETLRQRIGPGERASRKASSRESRPPIQLDELLDLAIQIAGALDAAHKKGIIHRDIKPANIFLIPHGEGSQVKLLDFGLAKQVRNPDEEFYPTLPMGRGGAESGAPLTLAGMSVGTMGYMSPEQARGEELDARTDLFSFGAVLFEMATGEQAISGNTTAMITSFVLEESPISKHEWNPDMPESLRQVVRRAMEMNRDKRYASASEMRADLEKVKREADAEADLIILDSVPAFGPESEPARPQPAPPPQGNPLWIKAAIAVLILAGLAAAVFFFIR